MCQRPHLSYLQYQTCTRACNTCPPGGTGTRCRRCQWLTPYHHTSSTPSTLCVRAAPLTLSLGVQSHEVQGAVGGAPLGPHPPWSTSVDFHTPHTSHTGTSLTPAPLTPKAALARGAGAAAGGPLTHTVHTVHTSHTRPHQPHRLHWHEVQALPVVDPATGRQAVLLLQTDITARAMMEKRMATLTETQVGGWGGLLPGPADGDAGGWGAVGWACR